VADDPLAGVDLQVFALECAIANGRHLVESRVGCSSRHGKEFGDSVTREGKRKDGSAISEYMPWRAHGQMSDSELKAIRAYLQTVPAVVKGNR
jgi:mono/diheme cytochrome c family protein